MRKAHVIRYDSLKGKQIILVENFVYLVGLSSNLLCCAVSKKKLSRCHEIKCSMNPTTLMTDPFAFHL